MMKIVATNVVASQPPERRPTATPTARAKRNRNESIHLEFERKRHRLQPSLEKN